MSTKTRSGVLFFLLLTLFQRYSAAAIIYSVTDLGSLGGDYSVGLAVNASGQVTGYSSLTSGATHAFLYSGGVMHDLGTLGGTESYGRSINDSGQVAGDSLLSGSAKTATNSIHAFRYSGGVMADLGSLGGTWSSGYGINASGQVSGWSYNAGDLKTLAFLYSDGLMDALITHDSLGRFINGSIGFGINANGQVTGVADYGGGVSHAFRYSGGVITDLGVLGGPASTAYAINASGLMTGTQAGRAVWFTGAGSTDLGPGVGYSINDSGQVTGAVGNLAYLYSDGEATNLNTLIDPTSGWVLTSGNGINNSGWITGRGTIDGTGHAFLLMPLPEPSSILLAATGLIGLLGYAYRRRRWKCSTVRV